MTRSQLLVLGLAALTACNFGEVPSIPFVRLDPILDSLFVGDEIPVPSVTYYGRDGNPRTPSQAEISWASLDDTILGVNDATGTITGLKRGIGRIIADVEEARGFALLAVSNPLDLRLLLDTVYILPGDTITLPVAITQKTPEPYTVTFDASPNEAVYTIDPSTGLVTGGDPGGPILYGARVAAGSEAVAATGAVHVATPGDSKFFFTVLGTANFHVGGDSIEAVNYARSDGRLAFRLQATHNRGASTRQAVQLTLPDSLLVADSAYAVDSLSPAESPFAVICTPPRPWAIWSHQAGAITAYSRRGGSLGITQIVAVQNGSAISGRFAYAAQRRDLYDDPLGILSIRGSFVAPLVTDRGSCR